MEPCGHGRRRSEHPHRRPLSRSHASSPQRSDEWGLLHAVTEGVSEPEYVAALDGYRYFGLHDAADIISTVRATASSSELGDDDLDALEAEADARYHGVVASDETLVLAFARRFEADRAAFASVE